MQKKKRKSITSSSELQNFSGVLTTNHVGYLANKLIEKVMNKGGNKTVVLHRWESIIE